MKRMTALTFLAALFISIGSVCAHAQTTVESRIPFSFIVNNQVLPAGTYRVGYTSASDHLVILIRSRDGRFHAASTTFAANDHGYSGMGKLVFTQYGNQYFLHEVLCGSLAMNAELPTTKMEKRARIQMAQLPPSQTTVATLRIGEK